MRIIVDADACAVIGLAVRIAEEKSVEIILVSDYLHALEKYGVPHIVVEKSANSADYKILSLLLPGDILVTNDYGLAALALAKKASVLNDSGTFYTGDNIDAMLAQRHIGAKARRAGFRSKGPKKRRTEQDASFARALYERIAAG